MIDPERDAPIRRRRAKRLRARRRLDLRVRQILAWADAFHRRTGSWPTLDSGVIRESDGDTWHTVQSALEKGSRGLTGGSSLARLLAKYGRKRNPKDLPRLTKKLILRWADRHYRRTGDWPTMHSGTIAEAPEEKWYNVDMALKQGLRGLPGGSTLLRLLAKGRGVRNPQRLPRLSIAQILAWADAFHRRTGRWPHRKSGPIDKSKGETWSAIETALRKGCRGFPGGSSLARFLAKHRGARNNLDLPALRVPEILAWVDAYHAQTGRWPQQDSGPVLSASGETWSGVNAALRQGLRGLPGGTTLYRLRRRHKRI